MQVQQKKLEYGDSLNKDKKKMGWKVYELMSKLFVEGKDNEYIFAHAFLTLKWNLMVRSENVVHAHILHVSWHADCLVFCFIKSKGDQMGWNHDQEWHVYANPHHPKICPVLALACYIFSNPGITNRHNLRESDEVGSDEVGHEGNSAGCLFPGGNQYNQFMDCLCQIIEKYPQQLIALGISPVNLGYN